MSDVSTGPDDGSSDDSAFVIQAPSIEDSDTSVSDDEASVFAHPQPVETSNQDSGYFSSAEQVLPTVDHSKRFELWGDGKLLGTFLVLTTAQQAANMYVLPTVHAYHNRMWKQYIGGTELNTYTYYRWVEQAPDGTLYLTSYLIVPVQVACS